MTPDEEHNAQSPAWGLQKINALVNGMLNPDNPNRWESHDRERAERNKRLDNAKAFGVIMYKLTRDPDGGMCVDDVFLELQGGGLVDIVGTARTTMEELIYKREGE